MSKVRLLVGTRKGAFVLTADGTRKDWKVSGPHFAGWELYHLKGSPVNPNRIYASQSSGWFGQVVQRSDDGGETWSTVSNKLPYEGVPGTHQWYDGTPHPWEFKRIWHLEPSLTEPDTVYAGVEDAALFRSTDGGENWTEMSGLRRHGTGPGWQPGAGGMCLHTIILDPADPKRMFIAISAAGAFRTDDGGESWKPINRGLHSKFLPNPEAEVGHCVHHIAQHPSKPQTLFMQKHWDVMRTDDAGDQWTKVSGNLPTDFGFVIDVHAHQPETVYVVPIKSDGEHFPLDGALRVYRSRSGGNEWEPLTRGLPQQHCYVNVLRDSMTVDRLDDCGVYFGTTGGQVYGSPDGGDTWQAIVRDLPAVLSVGGADAAMMATVSVELPGNLCRLANSPHVVQLAVAEPVTQRSILDALEQRYPMLQGCVRDHGTGKRRAFIRFFACQEDLSHVSPDELLPEAIGQGREPFLIIGAIAGG